MLICYLAIFGHSVCNLSRLHIDHVVKVHGVFKRQFLVEGIIEVGVHERGLGAGGL